MVIDALTERVRELMDFLKDDQAKYESVVFIFIQSS